MVFNLHTKRVELIVKVIQKKCLLSLRATNDNMKNENMARVRDN